MLQCVAVAAPQSMLLQSARPYNHKYILTYGCVYIGSCLQHSAHLTTLLATGCVVRAAFSTYSHKVVVTILKPQARFTIYGNEIVA